MYRVTTQIPTDMLEALRAKAETDKVPLAQVVRVALARYLKVPLSSGDSRIFEIAAGQFGRSAATVTVPLAWLETIQEHLARGNTIAAIKELRTLSQGSEGGGLGLYEAKCVVDALRAERG